MLYQKQPNCSQFCKKIIIDRKKNKQQRQMMRVSMLQILPYDKNHQIVKSNSNRESFTNTLQSSLKCKKISQNMTKSLIKNSNLYSHRRKEKKQDSLLNRMQLYSERQIVKINSLNSRAQIQEVIKKIKDKKSFNKQLGLANNKTNSQFKLSNYCRSNLLEWKNNNRFKRWESVSTCAFNQDKTTKKKQIGLRHSTERQKNNSLEDIVNKIGQLKGWEEPSVRYKTVYQNIYYYDYIDNQY